MEKGKITFEPSIPPGVTPLYRYHDTMREMTVIVAEDERGSGLTYLTYDGVSNMPLTIQNFPMQKYERLI